MMELKPKFRGFRVGSAAAQPRLREKKFAEMRLLVALLMSVVTVEGLVLSFRFVGFRFLLVSLLICIWVQIGAFEYFALPKEKIMT